MRVFVKAPAVGRVEILQISAAEYRCLVTILQSALDGLKGLSQQQPPKREAVMFAEELLKAIQQPFPGGKHETEI